LKFLRYAFLIASVSCLPAAVDFQREVRPILSDACFHCHGPDQGTRMAGLRLDTREGAFAERKSGSPIIPGKPDASLVIQRITHQQKARRMPPESSHKVLTPKQIDTLKRWVAEGAPWKEHWSFTAPVRTAPPAVVNKAWVRTPIDQFILAKLERQALMPAAAADRRTLIRRVTLDLTGLPPDPKDVEAFVADRSPNAYEKVVDRLLASEAWGEHRARYWLDAARYADTHGLHIDNYRAMWPYRDWVIKAFNQNMPFDQFTVEQIAGDLLPNPTMDQLIATGFHRCNVTTNEGGVIVEEVEAIYAKDRVDTTGSVFLGLTVGCATCHDHKFDPISQKDFYAMAAFFRNTTQNALDGNISDTPPVIVVPRPEDRTRWQQLKDEEGKLGEQMAKVREGSNQDFAKWLAEEARPRIPGPLDPADEVLSVSVGESASIKFKNQPLTMDLPAGVTLGEGLFDGRKALQFESKGALELPNVELFAVDRPFTISAWVRMPKGDDSLVVVSQNDPASKYRGWALELIGRRPTLRLTVQSNKSLQFRTPMKDRLTVGKWYHLAFTYDGSRDPSGVSLFVNGKSILLEGGSDLDGIKGEFRTFAPLRIGSDGRRRYFNGGAIADLRLLTKALNEEDAQIAASWPVLDNARSKSVDELTASEKDAFQSYFLHREYGEYQSLMDQLGTLRDERQTIARRGTVTHVQNERNDEPFAHILYRGMYDQPREKVQPAVPSALPPMPASYPKNRLGLAKWLVDESNPVTARVTVNRFWQELFGTGLVKTAEDLGSQGEAPSHPELLDWLAVEFRESGWDVKKLFQQMVLSSAYRQSARVTPLKLEKDPDNRLLSRGPRFRMDAEMVRDTALAASGLLVSKIGGPSVKPYQPEGVWEAVAMLNSNTRNYRQDSGDKLYRRSLYTFWKRSAPPASMDIFNAPSRENCTVRRERTNTPLQALVMMNDTQYVEAARKLAETAMAEGGEGFDARLDFITRRALSRPFDLKERAVAKKSYSAFLNHYDSNPADAKRLLHVGESQPAAGLNTVELASLTMLANEVLNLDEVLNK
jgi:hypothetical protein